MLPMGQAAIAGRLRDGRRRCHPAGGRTICAALEEVPRMKTPLARINEPVYALFRIVVGLLFTFHGAQKVFGAFGGHAQPLMTRLGAAGVIELVCGLLVAIGLLTWIAAFIASGEMVAAYYLSHMHRALWPIENGGELAVLYCVAFLFIATRGPGVFSVDR
jgi:putative oxidoreductase